MVESASVKWASAREAIFNSPNAKTKSKVISFFGVDIEIRQPTIGSILAVRSSDSENTQVYVIRSLLDLAYVPGTDDKVFEETDSASLLELPFGKDFQSVSKAMEELTEVNFQPVKES